MSSFPNELDTDADLPRIEDNVSEIGSEAINAIREAIFAIEQTLGTDVQGSTQDLKTRLDAILNPDGTFKSAALIAAGLIALPVTNSMVGSSAGILESKLDLDFPTQTLQDDITSNDIDIAVLQVAIEDILNRIMEHFDGIAFKHDGYAINLDGDFPSSPPPGIAPLTAVNVSDAIVQIKDLFFEHIGSTKTGAHTASNIAVDNSNFELISPTDLQDALEQLDHLGEIVIDTHIDDMHANGISKWANILDGYNSFLQKVPSTLSTSSTVFVPVGLRKIIDFTGSVLSSFGVEQGDVVLISSPSTLVGSYVVDDIGPRLAIGGRSALTSSQIEIVGTFPDDGYAEARIYGESSVNTLKGNLAPTIYQIDTRVDSVQVSRPNSARVVSLGINPRFINGTHSFEIEAGIASGISRTISINNLNLDRSLATVSEVTLDTLVERINYVLQNKDDGYCFPAAAYRVGDELMLAHNWCESVHHFLRFDSTGGSGNTLFLLGLDGYGANVLDSNIRPTNTSSFNISGHRLRDFNIILEAKANVVSQTFTFPNGENPIELGVRVGHLLQVFNHPTSTECGTYYITAVNAANLSVHKVAGLSTATNLSVKILSDAVPLDEIANYTKELLLEVFYDSVGMAGYNIRLEKTTNINNVTIIDVSDNYLADSFSMVASSFSGGNKFLLETSAVPLILPTAFNGQANIRGGSNIESLTLKIESPIITGSDTISVFGHINEEEVLEICSVRFDGILTLTDIKDKRLFGNTGLDELREDVVFEHVETPIVDLRSNGVVYGFDIEEVNFQDVSSFGSDVYGIVVRGGTAYVNGVRVSVPSTNVMIPTDPNTYFVYLNSLGTFGITNESDFSISDLLDGYLGELALIAKVDNSGSITNPLDAEDLRFFINDIDDKLDLILDLTNRRIGHFATVDAALNYINNYPFNERFMLRVVSYTTDDIVIPPNFNNISIQIDGQIGNLIIDSDCRVFGMGLSSRSTSHIDGYVSVGSTVSDFLLDSLNIASDLNITQAASAIGTIRNCNMSGFVVVTGSSSAYMYVNNSRITGVDAGISITDSFIICNDNIFDVANFEAEGGEGISISNCLFKNCGDDHIFEADLVQINGCLFTGFDDLSIRLNGNVIIDNCSFTDIGQSSSPLLRSSGSDPATVNIKNSLFKDLIMSGSGYIIKNSAGVDVEYKVDNNIFDSITFISDPTIAVDIFTNNVLTNSTNSSVISLFGGGSFTGNRNFNTVEIDVSKTSAQTLISDNIFTEASIGQNILAGDVSVLITNNIFKNIGAANAGITLTSDSQHIEIVDNMFSGDATAIGINMADALGDIIVSGNYFTTDTIFSFSSSINAVLITDNIFNSSNITSTTIQVGNDFKFNDNVSIRSNFILSGIAPQRTYIQNNTISTSRTFSIATPLTESIISDNKFGTLILVSGGQTNSTVSSNVCGLTVSGTYQLTRTKFIGNTITSVSSFSNLRWDTGEFSNNILTVGTAMTFNQNIFDTLIISDNTFSSNTITLTASSTLNKINYTNNTGAALTTSVAATNCNIAYNVGNITFSGGISSTSISNNYGGNSISVSGTINSSYICDNNCSTIGINPSTTSVKNIIRDNRAATQIGIMTTNAALELNQSIVKGNIAGTTLAIGNGSGTYTIEDSIIESNIAGTTFTSAVDSLQQVIYSQNRAEDFVITSDGSTNIRITNNIIFDSAEYGSNGSASTDVHICFNHIGGGLEMSDALYDNLVLTGNYVIGTLNLPANAGFNTGSGQSKAFFNFAETWASSGTLDTTSITGLFPWGNTGSGTDGSITFGGITAVNTATANNLSGGINT